MSVRATFVADFSKFNDAVEKAQVTLRTFESGIGRVDKDLAKFGNAFSGTKVIQDATLIAKAVEDIGGASKLTDGEMRRVHSTVSEALEKLQRLGQEAPKNLRDLEEATRRAEQPMGLLSKQAVAVGSAIGSFIGNIGANAVQAIGQKFVEAASNGAKFSALSDSFERLTRSIGQSGDAMLSMTRSATKGLITDLDIMQSSNKAILLGLPVTAGEMGKLAQTAVTLGRAMGQDATKSMDDLITALGRSSPQILDNLGLTVKLGEAHEAFAATLGKTASELTESEKKMAFYRAAMEAAERKVEELGEVQLTLVDQISRLGTAVSNAVTAMAAGANQASIFSRALGALADVAERAVSRSNDLAEAQKRLREENVLASAEATALQRTYDALNIGQAGPLAKRMADVIELRRMIELARAGDLKMPAAAPAISAVQATQAQIKALEDASKAILRKGEAVAKAAEKERAWAREIAAASQEVAWMVARLQPLPPAIENASASTAIIGSRMGDLTLAMRAVPWRVFSQEATDSAKQAEKATTGFFEGIKGGFKQLVEGMTNKDGLGGFMQRLGKGMVDGFGSLLTGGISSLINVGIDLAWKGIKKIGSIIGDWIGGGEHARVNDMRDAFLAQFGGGGTGEGSGFHELARKLTEITGQEGGGDLFRALTGAKTVEAFEAAVRAITELLDKFEDAANTDAAASGVEAIQEQGLSIGELATVSEETINKLRIAMNESAEDMLRFAATLRDPVITAINETIAAIERIPRQIQIAVSYAGGSVPAPAVPMAEGGSGRVTKPTLFLAGEKGPEDYAFSGAGRSFGGWSNSEVVAAVDRLGARLDRLPQDLAASMAIMRGRGASFAT